MHGLGNDFVVIDGRREPLSGLDLSELSIEMCDRHFGVGADGLLIVWPSSRAHYRMQVINPDGSEAEMCGNGIRCFAKYVYETDNLQEELISVETLAGIILPAVILDNGKVAAVEVDMGSPKDEGEITLEGFSFKKISMGNPHAVTFVNNLTDIDILETGPAVENNPHFPNRTNVEFVKVISDQQLDLLVWERGVGETLACGTGACAAVAAAVLAGKTGKRVLAKLPGGELDIEWGEEGHILMRGTADTVFKGEYLL